MALLLFPDASQRPPMPLSNDGRRFYCPCFGGTEFTVFTHANIPQASCPVCGSVCEPHERVINGTVRPPPTTVPSAGKKIPR